MAKSKYLENPDFWNETVKSLAREEKTDKEIIDSLPISKDTFYKWLGRHPDFSDALKEGRQPVIAKVESAFISRCLGMEFETTKKKIKEQPKVTIIRTIGKNGKVQVERKVEKIQIKEMQTIQHRILPDANACWKFLRVRKSETYGEKEDQTKERFSTFAELVQAITEQEEK